ncbi:MAG: histidine phosphatase family protein [Candidatus Taylorbacteria bacterium]|nr:histidine phosphatase family protein [Candidatus Taylorbacteria bacterium]
MNIFIIRHGETELNALGLKQGPEGSLSEHGRKQMALATAQLKDIKFSKIICSPYLRTKESAEILSQAISAPLEYSDLFKERKNPTEIIGTHKESQEQKDIMDLIVANRHDPSWHYSDEENFYDLVERARNALTFLENQEGENILIVSHAYFMGTMILHVLLGDFLTPEVFYSTRMKFPVANSGVSEIRFVEKDNKKEWRLITLNNYQHLTAGIPLEEL